MGAGAIGAAGATGHALTPEERTRLVRHFEGLFLGELWRAMDSTLGEGKGLFGGGLSGGGGLGPYGAIADGAWVDWLAETPLGNLGAGIEEALGAAIDRGELPPGGEVPLAALAAGGNPERAATLYRPFRPAAETSADSTGAAAATPAAGGEEFTRIARRVLAHDPEILAAAEENGLDPDLLRAVVHQESGGNSAARSPKGALGLMQLMPDTARVVGVTNALEPRQNVRGGARYLRTLLEKFGGDLKNALAAYNAGPGSVARAGGMPHYAETRAYVPKVLSLVERYRHAAGTAPGTSSVAPADPMGETGE